MAVNDGVELPVQVASEMVPLIRSGKLKPSSIVSLIVDIEKTPECYAHFDRREETKVEIRMYYLCAPGVTRAR